MNKLKSIAAGLALAALSFAPSFGQGVGQLGSGQMLANATANPSRGAPTNASAYFDFVYGSTRGAILERGASGWAKVNPSSTAGLPWASNGTGADPAYQTIGPAALSGFTSGAIYKGQGGSAPIASALSDNGTIVSSSESIDTTSNAHVQEVANAGSTGTTVNKLAKLTGSPSTAVIATTSDTTGNVIGIVVGGAGTTGNAQIAITGQASCVFDGAITSGHYAQVSTTAGGSCHDGGGTFPTSGQILGVIIAATNASPGSTPQAVTLFAPGTVGTTSSSSGTVTSITCATALGCTASNPITTSGTIDLSAGRKTLPTTCAGFAGAVCPTSGTGATYTTPANVLWIEVFVKGGGGGGMGSATTTNAAGSNGTASSFNSVVANPGSGASLTGLTLPGGGPGGVGGTGTANWRTPGHNGGSGINSSTLSGASGFGGGTGGGAPISTAGAGNAGATNSGAGGGGAFFAGTNNVGGAGGGEGEGFYLIINSPAATYTYTVGPGGAGGSSTNNGGAGAAGFVRTVEHYGS